MSISRDRISRASAEDVTSLVTDVGPVPSQVGAVLLIDTADGFDPDSARTLMAERIAGIPRLRQRLRRLPPGLGRPIWVDDQDFDIADHVTSEPAAVRDLESVLRIAAQLLTSRLPADRPLWAARFVPIDRDSIALVMVFHHVLTDGIGGLAVLAGLVDGAAVPEPPAFPEPEPTLTAIALDALGERLRSMAGLARLPERIRRAIEELSATGGTKVPRSSLNRPTGPARQLAVTTADLADLKAVAHSLGASVNDVVLSAVSGALRSLLESRGEAVDRFVVSVPVSRRRSTSAAELGNQVGVGPIELPCLANRTERVRVIASRGARLRAAPRGASAGLILPVFRALAHVGLFGWFTNSQRLVNSFVTNLRGPDEQLGFMGGRITDVLPLAGISGNVSVAFAVLSYAGTLTITVVADPEALPDLHTLREALQLELDQHVGLGSTSVRSQHHAASADSPGGRQRAPERGDGGR